MVDFRLEKFNNSVKKIVGDYLSKDGIIVLAENVWGSNPNIFEPMLQKNNLKITHDFASKQYPLDMWYLGIMRESAER